MDDWLIDDERLSIERKSVLPGAGFFKPDSVEEEEAEREAAESLTDAGVVVIADPDSDGLACVALVREGLRRGRTRPRRATNEIEESLEWAAEYAEPDATVVICDLCPDSEYDVSALPDLTERVADVRWYDHHQWNEELAEFVDDQGVERVVGDSDEVCTADVVLAELDHEFGEQFAELAAVTRDHDLWIREDERSDDLADLSYWSEPEEYIEYVLEHGPDLSPEIHEFLAEKRVEKEALIEKAVQRAELRDVGEWTVGVTYGRCSQNEVAEALREQGRRRRRHRQTRRLGLHPRDRELRARPRGRRPGQRRRPPARRRLQAGHLRRHAGLRPPLVDAWCGGEAGDSRRLPPAGTRGKTKASTPSGSLSRRFRLFSLEYPTRLVVSTR